NGLMQGDTILESNACLIQNKDLQDTDKLALINKLMPRLRGVRQAKESKYIMLHAPKNKLEEICEILPGSGQPTLLALAGSDDYVA
ncbi:ATP phosphoribosyltransferase, partial [Shewanella sp. CAL98-MNA-CIBAN-0140]